MCDGWKQCPLLFFLCAILWSATWRLLVIFSAVTLCSDWRKSVRLSVCLQYSLKVYWSQSLFFTMSRRLYTREAGFLYLSLDLWLFNYIYGETRAPLQETCGCKNFNILWIWSQCGCSVIYTCIFLNLNQLLLIANWNNSVWILVWRC